MDDKKKKALIFSDAGGTGFSFQSDRGAKNQRRRVHFLVQPGWRADKAVQGFGRTHRSNQANEPITCCRHQPQGAEALHLVDRAPARPARRAHEGPAQHGSQGCSPTATTSNRSTPGARCARCWRTWRRPRGVDDHRGTRRRSSRPMGLEGIYDPKTGGIRETKMPSMHAVPEPAALADHRRSRTRCSPSSSSAWTRRSTPRCRPAPTTTACRR
jgi:hypothetical protein